MFYELSRFELGLAALWRVGVLAVSCLLCLSSAYSQDSSQSDCTLLIVLHDSADRPLSGIGFEIRSATPPLERIRATTRSDGSWTMSGLRAAEYTVTVASAILSPPRSVHLEETAPVTLTVRLPITLPVALGHQSDQVSVQQLGLPPKLHATMQKAYDAWLQTDLPRSRALALAALQLRAQYPPALTLLGMIDLKDGKPDEAISDLLQALRQDPGMERAYLTLASAYNQQLDHIAALDSLSLMSKLAPKNWQLHYETGRAYLGQFRYQDAMQEFERAQHSSSDDNIVVHLAKAHALAGMQDYDRARGELETIQQISSSGAYSEESRKLAEFIDSHTRPAAGAGGSPPAVSARIEH